jgi:peptidoglycan-N-acetylglucosamine deacetylase
MTRRDFLAATAASFTMLQDDEFGVLRFVPKRVQDKLVVLTFDDAVKSHRTFVAPLLKEFGFRATFFVTQNWMSDTANFMSWEDIGELHRMGFEIGNHSWTHPNFGDPAVAARMDDELQRVEVELKRMGVPKPISFAWCGNDFGPEAIAVLKRRGYKLARRGMQPEVPYGKIEVGPAFDRSKHHPLLIPTTGDAYPDWTLDHFREAVTEARGGTAAVLQFHGVPDTAHPWVHTPPERFREYMAYLKQNRFRVVALRDLIPYLDLKNPPNDPMLHERYPKPKPPEARPSR